MAWVRRVRTTSGATAVQVAGYVDGRRRIVAHVGSAHDEAELGLLVSVARGMIEQGQPMLDFGVEMPVRQASLLGPPMPGSLFDGRAGRPTLVPVSPAKVVGTASVLLFDVVASVFDDLDFSRVGDQVFKDLVIAQVVEPTSLLDVDRVLCDLGRRAASLSTRKRTLARCVTGGYRAQVTDVCFNHASTSGDVSLCLYDVTTLRTQAEREDDFRKVGFSKDRSVDPQIVVGLLVDRAGFPLEIACFEGNKAEKHTIIPVIESFRVRHRVGQMVIAADAGMLSAGNLKMLDDAGYQFIVGSRATKAPIDLESHFAWHGEFTHDGQIVDTVTPKIGRNSDNDKDVVAEPVWDPETHPSSWRAIWQYSAKRFAHDNQTLNLQQARASAIVNGDRQAHKARFVKTQGGRWTLDQASLARARKVAGLKGYVTNMPASAMPAEEVIARYHDLWHVEQSFRITKSDLAARPFFARKRDAIEAHTTIVFTALAISRVIQQHTGLSIRRVLRALRPLRTATIRINGTTQAIPPAIPPNEQTIIDSIRLSKLRH